MAESVKVIVRCRPMNNREKEMRCQGVVKMDSERCTCSIANPRDCSAPDKSFTFDGVYHTAATTEQVYNDIVYPLVEGVLEGYNSTVFAYGQTGCGKSFTMQGVTDPPAQRGIIPRAFEHIFEAISVAEGTKYLVHASYLEIYNEEIRDLLGKDAKKRLALKELADRGVYVQDLSQHPVQSVADCERLMQIGWRNRASGATLMNADSSRSHSIFSVSLEMMGSTFVDEEDIRRGKLNLVDLAGSERQAKTGATGERLKEATKINLSLSALGNVISALVDGRSKHIPYRDSKLTRLLQDSLGGNTKTLMVGCVSPADNNYDETLSTLRYANRAKNICNKPVINQDPKDTMLQQYQEEIKKLKDLLQGQPIVNSAASPAGAELEREAVRLEFERKMASLRDEYAAEQDSKLRLQGDLDALRRRYEQEMTALAAGRQRETHKTPSELIVDQAMHSESSGAQREVLARLQKLQETMVGGERADDRELKEKRMKKKKASERRLQALAKVLAKVDDDEGVVLQVYDDINQELSLKTDALRKNRQKLRALDREIVDLQSEFENERTDYLETIRRQERQLKLWQQISEKIAPTLRREVNYSDLEIVKASAVWSDDADRWTLPELTVARTKLPPAGSSAIVALMPTSAHKSHRSSGSSDKSSGSVGSSSSGRSPSPDEEVQRRMLQRLQQSEREDIAGNYFKPKRATEILNRAKHDATNAFSTWKGLASSTAVLAEFSSRNKSTGSTTSSTTNNALNASLNQNGLHLSLNALNLNSSINGAVNSNGYQLATSWGNSINNNWPGGNHHNSSPETGMRRPIRLEALPVMDRKPAVGKRRGAKQELNTMDII